jgi:hypothetical protein
MEAVTFATGVISNGLSLITLNFSCVYAMTVSALSALHSSSSSFFPSDPVQANTKRLSSASVINLCSPLNLSVQFNLIFHSAVFLESFLSILLMLPPSRKLRRCPPALFMVFLWTVGIVTVALYVYVICNMLETHMPTMKSPFSPWVTKSAVQVREPPEQDDPASTIVPLVAEPSEATSPPSTPFVPAASPYSASRPPCTQYIRQDGCASYPPVRSDALPACGSISAATPGVHPFLIIGDWGHGGRCQQQVAALAQKLEQQFGRAELVIGLGDSGYWHATCDDLHHAFTIDEPYFGTWLDPAQQSRRAACRTPQHARDFDPDAVHSFSPGTTGLTARYYPVLGNHDFDHWHRLGLPAEAWPYFQFMPHLPRADPIQRLAGSYYSKTFFGEDGSREEGCNSSL